jgi:hypothetical protein
VNHHAIRRKEFRQMQQKKKDPKAKVQGTLDGAVKTLEAPREFTREGVLHAVTQFVACDDQVSVGNDFKRAIVLTLLTGVGTSGQIVVPKLPRCNEAARDQAGCAQRPRRESTPPQRVCGLAKRNKKGYSCQLYSI